MKYQAIPNGDRFLKLVKEKNDWGFLLGCFGFKVISDDEFESRRDVADFLDFVSEAEKIRRLHTGIENRQLYFGRKWDMLHYLLSENRRDNDAFLDENDWAYRAINGGDRLGDGISMPQGISIKHLTADEVKKIWFRMDNIPADSLEEHWNPPAMQEAGVYKIHPDDDLRSLNWIMEDFEKLKKFYLWTAIYKEGALVFCD